MIKYDNTINQYKDKILDYNRNLGNCIRTLPNPNRRPVLSSTDLNISINSASAFSVSLWAYIPTPLGTNTSFSLIQWGMSSVAGINITIYNSVNTNIGWGVMGTTGNSVVVSPGWVFNSWNNLLVNIIGVDFLNWEVYINGVKKTLSIQQPTPGDINTFGTLTLGSQGNVNARPAYVSSFMWFDKTLNNIDIEDILSSAGVCPVRLKADLYLYYQFERKNGLTVVNHAPATSGDGDMTLTNYSNAEVGIPSQSTNTTWCDSYTLVPIT